MRASATAISNYQPVGINWDRDRGELIADGIIHAIGLCLGLAGTIAIVRIASDAMHSANLAAIVVYMVGLLSMLGFSAAYNLWPISRAKWILRRFDHSAIYVMIAGTYTPFLAQAKDDMISTGLLISVWVTAAVGVILKLAFPGRFDRLAVVVYLLLGWSGVVVYEPMAAAIPDLSLWLLVAGGVLYSIGVIFHMWQSLRFQSAIWHSFVLAAAFCHYSAVLYCVARPVV